MSGDKGLPMPPARDAQASALLASHGLLAEQLGEVKQTLAAINVRLQKGDERMTRMEVGLNENTDLTRDFAQAKAGARVLRTVVVWLGGLAGGAYGIWQFVKAVIDYYASRGGVGPSP